MSGTKMVPAAGAFNPKRTASEETRRKMSRSQKRRIRALKAQKAPH